MTSASFFAVVATDLNSTFRKLYRYVLAAAPQNMPKLKKSPTAFAMGLTPPPPFSSVACA
jgi:hypothetical protein